MASRFPEGILPFDVGGGSGGGRSGNGPLPTMPHGFSNARSRPPKASTLLWEAAILLSIVANRLSTFTTESLAECLV
jgi:hypothetical protein